MFLGRGSLNRHNFRDVSHLSFIWIWTIHCCEGSEQSVHLNGIYHLRVCYIIGRGCCLLFAAGSPEPKWDNELIPTSFLFNLLSSGNCGLTCQKVGGRFRITSQSHCILLQSSTLIYSLEFSSSRSFPTFHRVKSSKSARQRQNQPFVPSARELLCNIPRPNWVLKHTPLGS